MIASYVFDEPSHAYSFRQIYSYPVNLFSQIKKWIINSLLARKWIIISILAYFPPKSKIAAAAAPVLTLAVAFIEYRSLEPDEDGCCVEESAALLVEPRVAPPALPPVRVAAAQRHCKCRCNADVGLLLEVKRRQNDGVDDVHDSVNG